MLLLFIMLLAAWLRLGYLDLIEFKQDEVQHLRLAEQVLHGHWALTGSVASVGLPKPPGMTYLMAIPMAFSRDPRIASLFIATLNVIAVGICYRIGQRYFGRGAGLIAALLYAVNPWAIVYARKVFTADVLPPFVALALEASLAAIVENRHRAWIWAFVWMTVLLQITFSALALVPAFAALILLFRHRVSKQAAIGAAIMAISFLPYLYAGLTQGFLRFWERSPLSESQSNASFLQLNAFAYALQLSSGADLHALAGQAFRQFLAERFPGQALDIAAQMLCAASMIYLLWLAIRRAKEPNESRNRAYTILAIYIWIPLLFDALPWVDLYPHYLVVLYPALFLAIGIGLRDVAERTSRIGRILVGMLILCLAAWQAYNVLYLYAFVDCHNTDGGYGLPVHYYITAAQRLETLAQAHDLPQAIVASDGDDVRWCQAPAVLSYLLEGRLSTRFVNGRESLVFPGTGSVLLAMPEAGESAIGLIQTYGQEVKELALPLLSGETFWRFFLWPPADRVSLPDLDLTPAEKTHWANGVALIGARVESARSDVIRWMTAWQVLESPLGADYHWFNHLVNAEGRKVSQKDGVGFPTSSWRAGDLVITWFDIPLGPEVEPDNYQMRVGMYTYPDIQNVALLDAKNNTIGEYVSLGPISVGEP